MSDKRFASDYLSTNQAENVDENSMAVMHVLGMKLGMPLAIKMRIWMPFFQMFSL